MPPLLSALPSAYLFYYHSFTGSTQANLQVAAAVLDERPLHPRLVYWMSAVDGDGALHCRGWGDDPLGLVEWSLYLPSSWHLPSNAIFTRAKNSCVAELGCNSTMSITQNDSAVATAGPYPSSSSRIAQAVSGYCGFFLALQRLLCG